MGGTGLAWHRRPGSAERRPGGRRLPRPRAHRAREFRYVATVGTAVVGRADEIVIDFRVGAPIKGDLVPHRTHETLYGQAYGRIAVEQPADRPTDAAGLLRLMDEHGISHVVVPVEDNETSLGSRTSRETLAAFCAENPERLIGFCGADPYKGMAAVRELEYAVRELVCVASTSASSGKSSTPPTAANTRSTPSVSSWACR